MYVLEENLSHSVPLPVADDIKVLGVVLDRRLTFHKHVSAVARSCKSVGHKPAGHKPAGTRARRSRARRTRARHRGGHKPARGGSKACHLTQDCLTGRLVYKISNYLQGSLRLSQC